MAITTKFLFYMLLCSTAAYAETVYKSVDENGNVSYSATPPPNSEQTKKIDIQPPPSEEDIKSAQQRHQRIQETAGILDEDRKKRNEMTAEEKRLEQEKQKQLQLQQQAEKNNNNQDYGYPYYYPWRYPARYPRHYPGGNRPGSRPITPEPFQPPRPVQLPAR
ncbi:MAG: DUF4124 domain-containing protein [Gammaproteobacteria bacterium]|nr:DUF4124 domain-containing protein [Gammaproteobacteria bacterium]